MKRYLGIIRLLHIRTCCSFYKDVFVIMIIFLNGLTNICVHEFRTQPPVQQLVLMEFPLKCPCSVITLKIIFSNILQTGIYPDISKLANVTPIFKVVLHY